MSKFKQFGRKTWVFGAAGAMILGGGTLLATTLSPTAFAATNNAHSNAQSAPSSQVQSSAPRQTAGGYTLMNLMNDSQTPGPQDLSVQKAAEDAANALNKKYGLDLAGYEFYPGFYKGAAPNTDIWGFKINTPPNTVPRTYVVTINAVTGKTITIGKP